MIDRPVIWSQGISKEYHLYDSPQSRLLEWLSCNRINRSRCHNALVDITFEISRGEFIGIIGKNGSGKSTLLKILSGVIKPTKGTYGIRGTLISLLELGTGFNPDLTGRQNVLFNGQMLGMNIRNLKDSMSEIQDFAEIGEYFDLPVKTYSSGMFIRLAMSIYLQMNPDIFLIDEALSVGDIFFQQKCFDRINLMIRNGTTFFLVSHDIELVSRICHRVMLLKNGRMVFWGDKRKACSLYYQNRENNNCSDTSIAVDENGTESDPHIAAIVSHNILVEQEAAQTHELAAIIALRITDAEGLDTLSVGVLNSLCFHIVVRVHSSVHFPLLSIILNDRLNQHISVIHHEPINDGMQHLMKVMIPMRIQPGEYTFDLGLSCRHDENSNTGNSLCEYRGLGPLTVIFDYNTQKAKFHGLVYLETTCDYIT